MRNIENNAIDLYSSLLDLDEPESKMETTMIPRYPLDVEHQVFKS